MYTENLVDTVTGYIKRLDPRPFPINRITSPRITLCTLVYREFDDGGFTWTFSPWWDRLKTLSYYWKEIVLDGELPGLDFSRPRIDYVFRNTKPPFVYQRTPPINRPDALELMEEAGIRGYYAMKFMAQCKYLCGNDSLIVEYGPEDDYDNY